jgi:hypothetical protein
MRPGKLDSIVLIAAAGALASGLARADVTIQEQSTFDLSFIKAHGTTTELTTVDKQRRDSALHCEGFMSMFCGNAQSGEITRLDRDVRWTLEPKRKEYRETPFLTPEQRKAAEEEMQANLEKLKQCPAAKQSTASAPDTQKCRMSPPKFDLVQSDQHASLLGHDSRLTQVTMTESCTNPDTGDSCDFQIAMDAWLTQDQIAGLEDRRAFQKAYMHKLGLDESDALVQAQMRRFLAPYQDSLKQLAAKAGDIKGYPLKTAVRIAFGGPHCAAAQKSQANNGDSSGGQNGLGAVASNLGNKLGGFFKKKTDPSSDASSAASAAPAPSASATPAASGSAPTAAGAAAPSSAPATANTLPPGMVQAAQFTVETQSITVGPIDPSQFEVPAGWKLVVPEASKKEEVSCPNG